MGTFNPDTFKTKLENLNSTQASIETLSNWCQFYRKQAQAVVSNWDAEFVRAPPQRRLLMLYLANDILQNSRKKGPEFQASFFSVLPRSLKHALKHFDEAARGKVNRLVAVWDERKVFGNSGARTIKDMLAEAETPRRKPPTGRNSGHSSGSASEDPGDNPLRSTGAAPLSPQLQLVMEAFKQSDEAARGSAALAGRCAAILGPGLLDEGTAAQLASAEDLLRHYSTALEGETSSLDAGISALQEAVVLQTDARMRAQDALLLATRQLSAVTGRLVAASDHRASPPLPPPEATSHPAVSVALPEVEANVLPVPTHVSPPLPGLRRAQPPLPPQPPKPRSPPQDANVHQTGASDMDVESSQKPPLPTGQQALLAHNRLNSSPPMPHADSEPSGVEALLQHNNNSGSDDMEAATAAAALVAQLSAAQDSQALLEALAALPQDQQREISLNFLNSNSMAAPSVGANLAGGDEEYDPEDAAF